MVRVRSTVSRHKRHKRVLKAAKGQFGQRSRSFSQAKRSLIKGMSYAYRDRKVRARTFRSLWIVRINAACRAAGMSYSRFMRGLSGAGVTLDRKVLADLAVRSPEAFGRLIALAKDSGPRSSESSA